MGIIGPCFGAGEESSEDVDTALSKEVLIQRRTQEPPVPLSPAESRLLIETGQQRCR
jgi:hypothetical protein